MSRIGGCVEALKAASGFLRKGLGSLASESFGKGDVKDEADEKEEHRRERREKKRERKDSKEARKVKKQSGNLKAKREDEDEILLEEDEEREKTEKRQKKKEKKKKSEKRKDKKRSKDDIDSETGSGSDAGAEVQDRRGRSKKRSARHEEKRTGKHKRRKNSEVHSNEGGVSDAIDIESENLVSDEDDDSTVVEGLSSAEAIVGAMLRDFGDVGADLKQLLTMANSGQGIDISGLPDPKMKVALAHLFRTLGLRRAVAGLYTLPQGHPPVLPAICSFPQPSTSTEAPRRTGGIDPAVPPEQPAEGDMAMSGGREGAAQPPPRKRMVGPAMPPPEILEAAALLTAAQEALRQAEEEMESDDLIGPVPVAGGAEAANASEAERFEEVGRILAPGATAYDILGVKQDATPAEMKKRYLRVSLLVHPDKCSHPQTQTAFVAVSKALKDLQDPNQRAVIDRKIEADERRKEEEAEWSARKRAAEWRRSRDEEQPGDEELLHGPQKELERETWMSELPPERVARQATTNTFFSRKEVGSRGDTSDWTDTPEEKAKRAQQMLLQNYSQAVLQGAPPERIEVARQEKVLEGALLDNYNNRKRGKSLMEVHQAERASGKNKGKKEKKEGGGGVVKMGLAAQKEEEDEWKGNHPWKPWDREKDITAGRAAVKLDSKEKMAGGLASRFGSGGGGGERQFL